MSRKRRQTWQRERHRQAKIVKRQTKRQNRRDKYGPSMRPSPLTIIKPDSEPVTIASGRLGRGPIRQVTPTRAEIESARQTRAQLAEWGVPWPPPRGWRKRLLREADHAA